MDYTHTFYFWRILETIDQFFEILSPYFVHILTLTEIPTVKVRLAKYGRSSMRSVGECKQLVTIIQINDEEHWKNCVRYITDREDGRSDVEPEEKHVEPCSRHRNHDESSSEDEMKPRKRTIRVP